MLDVRRLYYFVKTIDCKNMREAAIELRISQQGLQKQLTKLEKDFALKLYKISDESITVTHGGQYMYERVKPILEELDRWEAEVVEFQNSQSNTMNYWESNVS